MARSIRPYSLMRLGMIFWVALLLVAWPRVARAVEIEVSTNTDFDVDNGDNNCTLPEAIIAANTNAVQDECPAGDDSPTDIVVLAADTTYPLNDDYADYSGLTGLPSIVSTVVISGNSATITRVGGDLFRLLHVDPAGILVINDLTLSNGNADVNNGGAIANFGEAHLHNGHILTNTAALGGGIFNGASAELRMSNSVIRANIAESMGGGIMSNNAAFALLLNTDVISNSLNDTGGGMGGGLFNGIDSTMTLIGGSVGRNRAFDGGGIVTSLATTHISGTQIYSNTADGNGGGLISFVATSTFITNSQIVSNSAAGGAGLLASGGLVTLHGSKVNNNRSSAGGGGIFGSNQAEIMLTNSEVVANYAGDTGGGIETNSLTEVTLYSSAIGENFAESDGGGIELLSSTYVISDSYLYSNTARGDGGGIHIRPGSASVLIDSAVIYSNTAFANGGAIHNSAVLTLTDALVRANSAMTTGGGIHQAGGTFYIEASGINSNVAGQNGGAMEHAGGVGTIDNSCIVNNSTLAINHSGGTDLEAENNWWGSPDGPSGVGPGAGDSISEDVDYVPFQIVDTQGCPTRDVEIGFSKHVSPTGDLLPGQPVTYTLLITNEGDVDIYELLVNDNLPAAFDLDQKLTEGAAFSVEGDGYRLPILGVGEVGRVLYGGTVALGIASDQVLTNTGVISHLLSGLLTTTVSHPVVVPSLSWSAENYRAVEGSISFSVTATLSPTTPYAMVSVQAVTTDSAHSSAGVALVTELEFPPNSSSQPLIVAVGDDDSRAARTIALTLQAPTNAQLGDPFTATLVVTNTDSLGIDIEVSADRSAAQHGEVISYTYRISNTGSVELEDVIIEDEEFGQSFIISEFAPGRIEVRGYGLIVNNDVFPGPIENTAVVTGVDSEGDPVSDSDTLSIPVTGYQLQLPRLSSQGPEE